MIPWTQQLLAKIIPVYHKGLSPDHFSYFFYCSYNILEVYLQLFKKNNTPSLGPSNQADLFLDPKDGGYTFLWHIVNILEDMNLINTGVRMSIKMFIN